MPDWLNSVSQEQSQKAVQPHEVSGVEADEQALETLPASKDTFLESETPQEPTSITPVVTGLTMTSAPTPSRAPIDEVALRVEKIMEEGLGDYYQQLSPTAQIVFKRKGEEAATEISQMVRSLNLKVRRVLRLLRDWLLTIPGVNKFFLEQEAKIKTDRILELVEARKTELSKRP